MNPKFLTALIITGIVTMGVLIYSSDIPMSENTNDAQNKSSLIDATAMTEGELQTTCPILFFGGKINKNLYVDFQGKRIYACCDECVEIIRKDPGKYIKELEEQGIILEDIPITVVSKEGKIEKGERIFPCSLRNVSQRISNNRKPHWGLNMYRSWFCQPICF